MIPITNFLGVDLESPTLYCNIRPIYSPSNIKRSLINLSGVDLGSLFSNAISNWHHFLKRDSHVSCHYKDVIYLSHTTDYSLVRGVQTPTTLQKKVHIPPGLQTSHFSDLFLIKGFDVSFHPRGSHTFHTKCDHFLRNEFDFFSAIKPPFMDLSSLSFIIFFKYEYHRESFYLGSSQPFRNLFF